MCCLVFVLSIGACEEIKLYVLSLLKSVPLSVYEGLFIIFCLLTVVLLVFRFRKAYKSIALLALIHYIVLIYCSTLLFRSENDVKRFNFTPFWSYERPDMLVEDVMNMLVFVPVGLLLGASYRDVKWWKVLLIGVGLSLPIEILQLIFMRGFSEVDDVINNTLGCMIGYGLYSILTYSYVRTRKKNLEVL